MQDILLCLAYLYTYLISPAFAPLSHKASEDYSKASADRLRIRITILRYFFCISPLKNGRARRSFMRSLVQEEGLEPTRLLRHWILSPARLPVPPLLHIFKKNNQSKFPNPRKPQPHPVRPDTSSGSVVNAACPQKPWRRRVEGYDG